MSVPVASLNCSPSRCPTEPWPGERVGELARLRFRERDELRHVGGLHRRMHRHDVGHRRDVADRRKVVEHVERQALVGRRIDRERRGRAHADRVAVGRGLRDGGGAERAAGAGAVVDHDGWPSAARRPSATSAADHVGRAARRERHDHGDGLARIGVLRGRRRNQSQQRQGGGRNILRSFPRKREPSSKPSAGSPLSRGRTEIGLCTVASV